MPPEVPDCPLVIESVRGSMESAAAVDFGFGAGRLAGSIERIVGASLVASRVDRVLDSGLVTVGRVGAIRRRISVFLGCEVFLRDSGDGILLLEATSLRRGRRVNWPEDSAGVMSAALVDVFDFVAGRGVLLAVCFRISVSARATRARETEGGDAISVRADCRRVNRGLTSDRSDFRAVVFRGSIFVTSVLGILRGRTALTTFRSPEMAEDRVMESACETAVTD